MEGREERTGRVETLGTTSDGVVMVAVGRMDGQGGKNMWRGKDVGLGGWGNSNDQRGANVGRNRNRESVSEETNIRNQLVSGGDYGGGGK